MWAVNGQSNPAGNSSNDPNRSGGAVQAGATVIEASVSTTPIAVYPGAGPPACGPLPYMVDYIQSVLGEAAPIVIRSAANNQDLKTCRETHHPNIRRAALAQAVSVGVYFYWQGEFESADPVSSPAASYRAGLDQLAAVVWDDYPDALIVIMEVFGTSYSHDDVVRLHQEEFAAANPDRVLLVDPRVAPAMSSGDGVHATVGTGGGFDQMALRVVQAVLDHFPMP